MTVDHRLEEHPYKDGEQHIVYYVIRVE